MARSRNPRKGSLAYSPRKRAKSQVPGYKSWQDLKGAPFLQAFAGYKVGMTHVVMVDDHKNSPTEGKGIVVPVTVIEVPALKVAALRAYTSGTFGPRAYAEVWAEALDGARFDARLPFLFTKADLPFGIIDPSEPVTDRDLFQLTNALVILYAAALASSPDDEQALEEQEKYVLQLLATYRKSLKR
jgi:ribosomal protein L3